MVRIEKEKWKKMRNRMMNMEGLMIVIMVMMKLKMKGRKMIEIGNIVEKVEGKVREMKVEIKVNIWVI